MLPPFPNYNNQSDQNTSDTTREEGLNSDSFGDSYEINHYNHDKPNKKRKLKTLDDIVRKIAKQNGGCHQDDESVEPIRCIGTQESELNGNRLQENEEFKTKIGEYRDTIFKL